MMERANIQKSLDNIEYLSLDVNINEITSHIRIENLSQWISAWRNAMKEQINNIKEAIKNE